MCTVVKADGKVCGAWCDKRAAVEEREKGGGVCEYHLERAVMRRRAGRNEFAAGYVLLSTLQILLLLGGYPLLSQLFFIRSFLF